MEEKNSLPKFPENVPAPPPGLEDETVSALRKLAITLERTKFGEYIAYMSNTKRLVVTNLVAGLFRGMGLTLGATILVAIVFYILNQMAGIPIIGDWIARVARHAHGQIGNIK